MRLLGAMFGAGVALRNALYDHGVLRARQLQAPVVSVGNLSVGGAGKTPFVLLLGELLKARGIEFDVLTRGYGRASRGVAVVDPAGSAAEFGDEPLLLARRLGVPVIVGEKRYAAGILAEQKFGPRLHLLDDGFQHRQLARDFDIVLLMPDDVQDHLLPEGRLRESLSALRRAHAVVLTCVPGIPDDLPDGLLLEGTPLWRVRRGIRAEGVPPTVVAFCGIARPQLFFGQLRSAGIALVAEAGFRDHHAYKECDVAELLSRKRQSGAAGFVTTEKDAINLGPLAAELQPLAVVRVAMELADAQAVIDHILTKTGPHRTS